MSKFFKIERELEKLDERIIQTRKIKKLTLLVKNDMFLHQIHKKTLIIKIFFIIQVKILL
jgi:hypothetical protein